MTTDADQSMFEQACIRLFDLHADGFERPRPAVRPIGTRAAAAERAERTERRRLAGREPALAPTIRRAAVS